MSDKRWYLRKSDLAVCTVCVALGVLTLGAVGERGRRRAMEAVCQTNLRQWHGVFQEIIRENDGQFLAGTNRSGYWWPVQLPHELQDWKRNRTWFCPAATTPIYGENGTMSQTLTTFSAWGIYESPTSMTYEGKTYTVNANGLCGSLGLNGYVLDIPPKSQYEGGIPASNGWRNLNDEVDGSSIPFFFDAMRFDQWPKTLEGPAPSESAAWSSNSMGRVCINRHDGVVNCLFVDGSARKVGLKELWTLKWHRVFNTAGPWTKAGGVQPENWPEWIRPFKDY